MENKREIRSTVNSATVDAESRMVEGYALLFNTPSDNLDFIEVIDRGALNGVIESSDVFALVDHNQNRGVLARSKNGVGTLKLEVDERGLKYSFEAPKTALGDELLENLRRGEIDQSSFSFTVGESDWEDAGGGVYKRTIRKINKLYDVSPVYTAAYSATTVYARGAEQANSELQEFRKKALESYYQEIEKSFNI